MCLALGTVVALVSRFADAQCSQDYTPVSEYSYAAQVVLPVEAYPSCMREAEETACEGAEGLECAREMQRLYSACVGQTVCDELVGKTELDRAGSEQAYWACLDLVVSVGGEF